MNEYNRIVSLVLRLGLAFAFLYVAFASFVDPTSWIGFFPPFLRGLIPDNILLVSFSIYELLLGAWLVWGRAAFFSGVLSALTLAGIVLTNLAEMDIVFRDVSIFSAAVALAILHYHKSAIQSDLSGS